MSNNLVITKEDNEFGISKFVELVSSNDGYTRFVNPGY
jgi:hypothetical protein